jgi:hypothetical protein
MTFTLLLAVMLSSPCYAPFNGPWGVAAECDTDLDCAEKFGGEY